MQPTTQLATSYQRLDLQPTTDLQPQ